MSETDQPRKTVLGRLFKGFGCCCGQDRDPSKGPADGRSPAGPLAKQPSLKKRKCCDFRIENIDEEKRSE
ncbi:MAG TPA: hypothetical protein GXX40_08210 [Firmicutes bacterium]|nr:hypothetical protein [Bacillota bacterium]